VSLESTEQIVICRYREVEVVKFLPLHSYSRLNFDFIRTVVVIYSNSIRLVDFQDSKLMLPSEGFGVYSV